MFFLAAVFGLVSVQSSDPLADATRSFMLFAAGFGFVFLVVALVTGSRVVLRSRERRRRPASVEDLFDPEDVDEVRRLLQLTEAAAVAELEREAFDALVSLSVRRAVVAASRADTEWGENGGRRRVLTVVFDDTSTFRFVLESPIPAGSPQVDEPSVLVEPGSKLVELFQASSGVLALRFETPSAYVTLEVVSAALDASG